MALRASLCSQVRNSSHGIINICISRRKLYNENGEELADPSLNVSAKQDVSVEDNVSVKEGGCGEENGRENYMKDTLNRERPLRQT